VIGTWKLDVAKSMFAVSAAFKAQTRTHSQSAQGIALNMRTIGTDGKETTVQTTYQLDGKTLTATAKNAKGEDTLIFNKQ